MFTTANLMSPGCAHYPDTELKLFYDVIKKNIPNNLGISFQECSSNLDVGLEKKLKFWELAF